MLVGSRGTVVGSVVEGGGVISVLIYYHVTVVEGGGSIAVVHSWFKKSLLLSWCRRSVTHRTCGGSPGTEVHVGGRGWFRSSVAGGSSWPELALKRRYRGRHAAVMCTASRGSGGGGVVSLGCRGWFGVAGNLRCSG